MFEQRAENRRQFFTTAGGIVAALAAGCGKKPVVPVAPPSPPDLVYMPVSEEDKPYLLEKLEKLKAMMTFANNINMEYREKVLEILPEDERKKAEEFYDAVQRATQLRVDIIVPVIEEIKAHSGLQHATYRTALLNWSLASGLDGFAKLDDKPFWAGYTTGGAVSVPLQEAFKTQYLVPYKVAELDRERFTELETLYKECQSWAPEFDTRLSTVMSAKAVPVRDR